MLSQILFIHDREDVQALGQGELIDEFLGTQAGFQVLPGEAKGHKIDARSELEAVGEGNDQLLERIGGKEILLEPVVKCNELSDPNGFPAGFQDFFLETSVLIFEISEGLFCLMMIKGVIHGMVMFRKWLYMRTGD
jgi:hypothetical protein